MTIPEAPEENPIEPETPVSEVVQPKAQKSWAETLAVYQQLPLWARIVIPLNALIVVILLLSLSVSAAGGLVSEAQAPAAQEEPAAFRAFHDAEISCSVVTNAAASIGDEGTSMTLDMKGKDDFDGLSFKQVFCVLDELDVPDSVSTLMEKTRALDVRQTAEWGDISASWSYHPDSGLDLILSLKQ